MKIFLQKANFRIIGVSIFLILLTLSTPATGRNLLFRHLTVENGLSQNSVMTIAQDNKGFMWFGTRYGLNRYDGFRFKIYKKATNDSTSLSDNQVNTLLTDDEGTLWVGTVNGLNKYDAQLDRFIRIQSESKKHVPHPWVNCLLQDSKKNIWMCTAYGVFILADKQKNTFKNWYQYNGKALKLESYTRVIYETSDGFLWVGTAKGLIKMKYDRGQITSYQEFVHDSLNPNSLSGNYITSITEDNAHNLWIGTLNSGANIYNPTDGSFKRVAFEGKEPYYTGNNIRRIIKDRKGDIWIGTQNGLYIYNPQKGMLLFQHDPDVRNSLNNNSIHSIFQDRNGTIWLGTYHAGINVTHSYTTAFTVYQNTREPSCLSNDVVSAMAEDEKHNLWIGTEGGGLNYFDRAKGSFKSYKNIPGDNTSISSNFIKSVYKDKSGRIWVGASYNGDLNLYDPKTDRFRHFAIGRVRRDIQSFDEVLAITDAANGNLLVGTQSGLSELKKKTDGSYEPQTDRTLFEQRLTSRNVHALLKDSKNNLWIGTSAGLYQLKPNNELRLFHQNDHADSLHEENINCIVEDSKGNVWIGTYYGGLSRYDAAHNKFITYTDKDGLPNNDILGILEDSTGKLWLSTENGLSRFNTTEKTFKTYTTSDGLAGNKFNYNSFFEDSKGEMFFGGNNGLTAFFPQDIQVNKYVAPVVFTSLTLSGKQIDINGEDELLHRNFSLTDELSFKYNQSFFTINFALLSFIKPEKNRYAYKMEGYEDEWNYVNTPSATYSNLPAGDYTFLVKGANNDGIWNTTPSQMRIHILPPLWRTWWAYTLYFLAVCSVVFFVLRFFYLRALYLREHELQQFKLNFFTNVSHEIRTHLTLISAPVEKLLFINKEDPFISRQLHHIKSNADRLLQLVNELMDFRKAETKNLPLHVSEENIAAFAGEIFTSFQDVALSRKIAFTFTAPASNIRLYFDKRQMEKVIFNLVTNAFKFTPDRGFIKLELKEQEKEICLLITNNGKGIAPENIKKLFTNFFQVEEEHTHNTGYGIGLALSKSIVELHKGTLSVTSNHPEGEVYDITTFAIVLPKGKNHFEAGQLQQESKPAPPVLKQMPIAPNETDQDITEEDKKPTVLLVEDNRELRDFLSESLSSKYTILEAMEGAGGLEIATEQIPDLVISDVMMPGMDGYALCKHLKTDERTSHVPVILLTAKVAAENQVEGLSMGADAYITKPFSLEVLELHANNLIATRQAIRLKYSRQIMLEPLHIQVNDIDEDFLKKVISIIEEYLDDPEFDVTTLSKKVAMSQPVLYKKMKALTNMTVNDFIKSIRLKKAEQLLSQSTLTVAEVAYAVGFNRRKYFSEEFKKQFGKTPSEYMGQKPE